MHRIPTSLTQSIRRLVSTQVSSAFGPVLAFAAALGCGDPDGIEANGESDGIEASGGIETGAPSSCDVPSDPFPLPAENSVSLRIENRTDGPVFIADPGCMDAPYQVELPAGIEGSAPELPGCHWNCRDAAKGNCPHSSLCQGSCSEPLWRIEPEATLEVRWSGRIERAVPIPEEEGCCVGFSTECTDTEVAPPGEYRILVDAFAAAADCGDACEVPCEEAEAACEISQGESNGEFVRGRSFSVRTSFDVPASEPVVVVIES